MNKAAATDGHSQDLPPSAARRRLLLQNNQSHHLQPQAIGQHRAILRPTGRATVERTGLVTPMSCRRI
jgi:hypothetical protein